jgi:bile acid:Na+ symporter, BASS family
MNDAVMILFKVSVAVFMAGNLLDMGLRLNPRDALRGLRSVPFVAHTLLWSCVLGPALAYAITAVLPLEQPYATGLILLGLTPCAPFLPMIVSKAKGDLGFTAAFMLLASAATVVFMPIALPMLVKGLSISAWAIARPLLMMILLPLVVGIVVLRASPAAASRIQPVVKRTSGIATVAVVILCGILYGKGLLGVPGSLALASQVLFFSIVTTCTYWCGIGLRHEQRIVLCTGMTTRNLGAALAPLLSVADMDQRAFVMLVLGLPTMVGFAWLAVMWFGRHAPTKGRARPTMGE